MCIRAVVSAAASQKKICENAARQPPTVGMWPGASLDDGDADGDDDGVEDGFGDGFVDADGDDVGFGDDLCGVLLAVAGTDAGDGCVDACAETVSSRAASRRDCASTNFDPGGCLRINSACSSCSSRATSVT